MRWRQPEWLAENLDNPLREWDGRRNISAAKFRKSVAQYRATRRAVLAALAEQAPAALRARLVEYGAAFNVLSRGNDFIEKEEREDLLAALMAIPAQSGLRSDEAATAGEWLANGVDEVRNW